MVRKTIGPIYPKRSILSANLLKIRTRRIIRVRFYDILSLYLVNDNQIYNEESTKEGIRNKFDAYFRLRPMGMDVEIATIFQMT